MTFEKLKKEDLEKLTNDDLKEILIFIHDELSKSAEYHQEVWFNSKRTIEAARGYANACYKNARKLEILVKKKNE
jgi:hypothetical protein